MANSPHSTDRPDSTPWPPPADNREWRSAFRRRRFDRITLGFWLGGVALGAGGCLLGAMLPYHHPAARVASVLWWGLIFGCFGASLGALVGQFTQRTPVPLSRRAQDAGKPATGTDIDVLVRPAEPAGHTWATAGSEMVSPETGLFATKRVTGKNLWGRLRLEAQAEIQSLQAEVAQLQVRFQALQQQMQEVCSQLK